jgi:hypothetical protein
VWAARRGGVRGAPDAAATAAKRADGLPRSGTLRGVETPILVGVELRDDFPVLLTPDNDAAALDQDLCGRVRNHHSQGAKKRNRDR